MIEIRQIKKDEHLFLWEMLGEAIYLAPGEPKLPRSIMSEPVISKYVENFGRFGDFAFVLVDENELAGAVWTRLFDKNQAGYGFIDEKTPELSMAVRENHRGKGFGGLLIERLLEKLKTEGFKQVSLSVDKRNRAVNLYRRFGFEIVAERGTAYTMLKKLE